ncbi:MAG: NADH-quinone oxidoreductase subunit NuoB [Candidatus Methanoperedens sp.]|nr:NADH-quinone oxidoreductase subunit NuoB [Candidatus Methanoperedens sp.]
MLDILIKTFKTGTVTTKYPDKPDIPPIGFRGKPEFVADRCTYCGKCVSACPPNVIRQKEEGGKKTLPVSYCGCIFCGRCEEVCSYGAIKLTQEYELASKTKEKIKNIFGRSLHIREVDAGSCNGCEVEVNALSNPVYDIERLGLHIVASPRHADMLLVTGPVSRNMELALLKTYNAAPEPKLVAAMGSCACNGGIFGNTYASGGGVDKFIPVDVYIPGCPPRPQAVIFGIMVAIDKLEQKIQRKDFKI